MPFFFLLFTSLASAGQHSVEILHFFERGDIAKPTAESYKWCAEYGCYRFDFRSHPSLHGTMSFTDTRDGTVHSYDMNLFGSASFYSLLQTMKRVGLDPDDVLRELSLLKQLRPEQITIFSSGHWEPVGQWIKDYSRFANDPRDARELPFVANAQFSDESLRSFENDHPLEAFAKLASEAANINVHRTQSGLLLVAGQVTASDDESHLVEAHLPFENYPELRAEFPRREARLMFELGKAAQYKAGGVQSLMPAVTHYIAKVTALSGVSPDLVDVVVHAPAEKNRRLYRNFGFRDVPTSRSLGPQTHSLLTMTLAELMQHPYCQPHYFSYSLRRMTGGDPSLMAAAYRTLIRSQRMMEREYRLRFHDHHIDLRVFDRRSSKMIAILDELRSFDPIHAEALKRDLYHWRSPRGDVVLPPELFYGREVPSGTDVNLSAQKSIEFHDLRSLMVALSLLNADTFVPGMKQDFPVFQDPVTIITADQNIADRLSQLGGAMSSQSSLPQFGAKKVYSLRFDIAWARRFLRDHFNVNGRVSWTRSSYLNSLCSDLLK